MVEEMLAARGICVSCETVRRWAINSAGRSPVRSADGPRQFVLDIDHINFIVVGNFRGFSYSNIWRQVPVRYCFYRRVVFNTNYVRDNAVIRSQSCVDDDAISRWSRAISGKHFNFWHDILLQQKPKLALADHCDDRIHLIPRYRS